MTNEFVTVFNSQNKTYEKAFKVFLQHTDQKKTFIQWINTFVKQLSAKNIFIDVGAGEGEITKQVAPYFQSTLAIEPNLFLVEHLQAAVPQASIISKMIMDAEPNTRGDLILCSHTFYYIDRQQWLAHLERLSSWMSARGVTLIVLQNHETDCMKMLEHFLGRSFNLNELKKEFLEHHADHYTAEIERIDAQVTTHNFEDAYTIVEFMLNLLPLHNPPKRQLVEEYIREHFAHGNGYRFSCHQDVLEIRQQ